MTANTVLAGHAPVNNERESNFSAGPVIAGGIGVVGIAAVLAVVLYKAKASGDEDEGGKGVSDTGFFLNGDTNAADLKGEGSDAARLGYDDGFPENVAGKLSSLAVAVPGTHLIPSR